MNLSATLALPAYRHLPGINQRPAENFLNAIATFNDPPVSDATAATHLGWQYGLRLINQAYYWEAHEVLEPVWWQAAANSPARHLVQTTIHLTNGALKIRLGRVAAAHRLASMARQGCERAFTANPAHLLGLTKAQLIAAADSITNNESAIVLKPNNAL